jgi:hypothetical protein
MTSLAAILGLSPLALGIGPGAQMQQPLAVMVIGGLTANMLFTRMIIPVGYILGVRLAAFPGRIRNRFKGKASLATTMRKLETALAIPSSHTLAAVPNPNPSPASPVLSPGRELEPQGVSSPTHSPVEPPT